MSVKKFLRHNNLPDILVLDQALCISIRYTYFGADSRVSSDPLTLERSFVNDATIDISNLNNITRESCIYICACEYNRPQFTENKPSGVRLCTSRGHFAACQHIEYRNYSHTWIRTLIAQHRKWISGGMKIRGSVAFEDRERMVAWNCS